MQSPLQPPGKEVDVGFLVFIQRYATELLKWDILTFFARHPNFSGSVSHIAQDLGRSTHTIQPELGDLTLLGILERQQTADHQVLYQLTKESYLRRMILKFANQLSPPSPA
jgi:hypothetical protein